MVLTTSRTGLKVGELARRTGVSVRTLHYYDEVGLLSPSDYTESGHRLYSQSDIVRLQQVVSLRQLGLSLDEIKGCLDGPGFSPLQVIELHTQRLEKQIALQKQLVEHLRAIASSLRLRKEVSVEDFMQTIEEITSMNTEFTLEQMEKIKEQGRILGEEHIHEVEREWPQLIAQVRDELDRGTPPTAPHVQQLAKRWMELVREFTGGDPGIERVLANKYKQDPTAGRADMDSRMLEYIAYIDKALK